MDEDRDIILEPADGENPASLLRSTYPKVEQVLRGLAEGWTLTTRPPVRRLMGGWSAGLRLESGPDLGLTVLMDLARGSVRIRVVPDTGLLRTMWWLLSASVAMLALGLRLRTPLDGGLGAAVVVVLAIALGTAVAEISLRVTRTWLAGRPGWSTLCAQLRTNLVRALKPQPPVDDRSR